MINDLLKEAEEFVDYMSDDQNSSEKMNLVTLIRKLKNEFGFKNSILDVPFDAVNVYSIVDNDRDNAYINFVRRNSRWRFQFRNNVKKFYAWDDSIGNWKELDSDIDVEQILDMN